MQQQKGQIHIIILALIVVGFIAYTNFSSSDIVDRWLKSYKITPAKKVYPSSVEKAKISAPPAAVPVPVPPTPIAPIEPDVTPPKRLNSQPKDKSSLPAETRKITLGLETDENATCKYGDIAGLSYNSMQHFFDQTSAVSHSTLITTLSEGGQYEYFIKCQDEAGNTNIDDFSVSFSVKLPDDKTPPILTNPSHQGAILPKDTKEMVITISTNEPASCRYSANAGTAYSSMPGSFSYYDQTQKFHTKNITGLQNGKIYDFFVRCRDSAGNSNIGDVLISFSVEQ